MEENLKQILIKSGIDVDDALKRFMNNENLFLKYLKKYPDDENLILLKQSLENGEIANAYNAAHTLKGICGNFSMNCLFEKLDLICNYLKNGDLDLANVLFKELQIHQERIINVIKENLG